ncbi:MAG: hypothetical protein RLY16_2529 [Bacteroidota bacterium]|jgi:hypothetical protein
MNSMKNNWIKWWICLLGGLTTQWINKLYYPVKNILPLEFARNENDMLNQVMAIASSANQSFDVLWYNTLVDCFFLVIYTLLFYYSVKILLAGFQQAFKQWMVFLIVATGFWDIIENYFLLTTAIRQQINFSMIYFWSVRIKWMFAVLPGIIVPAAILFGIFQLLKKVNRKSNS